MSASFCLNAARDTSSVVNFGGGEEEVTEGEGVPFNQFKRFERKLMGFFLLNTKTVSLPA